MYQEDLQVKLSHTDATGVIYFAELFRMASDAYEQFLARSDFNYAELFYSSEYATPIVHSEADYLAPIMIGNILTITLSLAAISEGSYSLLCDFVNEKGKKVGKVITVHACILRKTRQKAQLPAELRDFLTEKLS